MLLQSLKLKVGVGRWPRVAAGWPKYSPSCLHVGLRLEPGLESTVCILLGPFMSSEHDDLVCLCNTEGSNKGQQRGFLRGTLWRLVSPESTYEWAGWPTGGRWGKKPWAESQGTKFWRHPDHLLPVPQKKALNHWAQASPQNDETKLHSEIPSSLKILLFQLFLKPPLWIFKNSEKKLM